MSRYHDNSIQDNLIKQTVEYTKQHRPNSPFLQFIKPLPDEPGIFEVDTKRKFYEFKSKTGKSPIRYQADTNYQSYTNLLDEINTPDTPTFGRGRKTHTLKKSKNSKID